MTNSAAAVPVIESVAGLAAETDAWLCDVWGVVHNGERPFPSAVEACRRFRGEGGTVVLISNSPRPRNAVSRQLDEIGVAREAYDAIVSSGDVTRELIGKKPGQRIFHLGPERDGPIFEGLDVILCDEESAEVVVCSGLYDDTSETPDDYADLLARLKARALPMICANPDLQVERGETLVYCAGALAAEYERIGGRVIYAGKPHAPIYELALRRIGEIRGGTVARERILCIGDSVNTDMAGAAAFGLKALFIASRLHIDAGPDERPLDGEEVAGLFTETAFRPLAAQDRLCW